MKATFIDQVRRAVNSCGLGRNELARRVRLDRAQMSRFMAGKGFLSERSLNRLAAALRLRIVTTRTQGNRERGDR